MKKNQLSLRVTTLFKRFQRKSYAAFNSLKREVSISVLPIACLAFVSASNAFAQSKDMAAIEHQLEGVDVWGREVLLETRSFSTGMISVIPREQIDKMAVQTIQCLLKFVSNVDVRQRGGHGVQASINIRGGSSDQIVMLLNGVKITDPQTGHYNLNIPIDIASVDRIEILHGSGARALGISSFGGAINIITGEAQRTGANFEVIGGSYGFIAQSASFTLVPEEKPLSIFTSINHKRSEGYIENTDFSILNAYMHGTYFSERLGRFQFQFGYQDKSHGANSFYSFRFPNQFDHTRTFFSALEWRRNITANSTLSAQTYWRRLSNRFELFRDFVDAPDWYEWHNHHQTNILGANLKFNNQSSWGRTTIGTGVRNEHIHSNVLGDLMQTPIPVPHENAFFTHERNRFQTNIFANQSFYLRNFTLAGGLIANHNDAYGFNFSGGIDLSYSITPALRASATANRGFRLPTFTDLYYSTATHIANPNLRAEKATIYEVGLKYFSRRFRANASLYYRMANDVIDWVRMPESEMWQTLNHTEINALGTDLWFQYLMPDNPFLQQVKLSYSFMTQNKNADGFESRYALEYLNHKVTLFFHHQLFRNFHLSWNINYRDRNGSYLDPRTNEITEYEPVLLVNARLQWRANNNTSIFVNVDNVFNVQYADFGGLIQAGRWLKGGIRVNI